MKLRVLIVFAMLAAAQLAGCYYSSKPIGDPQGGCTRTSYGLFPVIGESSTACDPNAAASPAAAAENPPQK